MVENSLFVRPRVGISEVKGISAPKCPTKDKWGNPYIVYSGAAVAHFPGFSESTVSKTDFIIVSYGRKGLEEHFVFDPDHREAGIFEAKTMTDYDKNLVNWNGTWIRAPRS